MCLRSNDTEQNLSPGVQALGIMGLASSQTHIGAHVPSYCHANYASDRDVLLLCSLCVLGGNGARGQAVTALSQAPFLPRHP